LPIRQQPLKVAENEISIGNNVWIAARYKILKESTIHNGAVTGAISLVNCEIPKNGIAYGIPARAFKKRILKQE